MLSRKSNVNKNSFYKSKALGKLPEYLPNKPTVVGSRGGLPNLQSSGGITANSPYVKASIKPAFQKYGGGIGGLQPNPY